MKIKHLLLASVALIAGMASCSKDDNGGIEEGATSLFIKFEGLTDAAPGSRAETGGVSDQTEATLTTGIMFFAKDDALGTIVRKVEISNYATPGAVTPQQLADGKLFEDIDAGAKYVHVFGNHNFQKNPAYYTTISEIEAEEVDLLDQTNNTTWGVDKANLYGRGPIVPASSATQLKAPTAKSEAIFEVSPLIARLEIGKFQGGTNIVSYELAGVYVHNFYEKMGTTGALAASPNNTPWVVGADLTNFPLYAPEPSPGVYKTGWNKYLYDYYSTPMQSASKIVEITTPAGNLWAYNVLANAGADPHIVIHLKNVKLDAASTLPKDASNMYQNPETNNSDAYLTITGYRQGGAKVDVVGGNIYKMNTLTFGDGDLGETPYPGDDKEKVWVEVTVKKWNLVLVEPEFN